MSLFKQLGNAPQQSAQQINNAQAMQELRANPSTYLKKMGLSIPDGMTDPRQITQYLINSGQVTQPILNRVMSSRLPVGLNQQLQMMIQGKR